MALTPANAIMNFFDRCLLTARAVQSSPVRCIPKYSQFRSVYTTRPRQQVFVEPPDLFTNNGPRSHFSEIREANEKPAWLIHKEAVKRKLGGAAWNPRKRLSPDTMEGIKHLHKTQPQIYSTEVLAEHFKVTPDAIRRILRSKWRPSDEEYDSRLQRWDKRGERIWSNLVELGVKPPKRWREMGVGKAEPGEKPKWKSRQRNRAYVHDNFVEESVPEEEESIIPIVGLTSRKKPSQSPEAPLLNRLGV